MRSSPSTIAEEGLSQEAEIWVRETTDIRKHSGHVAVSDAEPAGDGGGKLVHTRGRNPPTIFRIVRTVDGKSREGAVELMPPDGASHDELMAAPTVIAAGAVGR